MFLFDEKSCCDICVKNKSEYVSAAVNDLIGDFRMVSKSGLSPKIVDEETENCIIIDESASTSAAPIEGEGFTISVKGGKARIKSDGYLGAIWGIYTFSEKFLGVSPCYLFDDLAAEKKVSVTITDTEITDRPKSFGFRGIFINDEDYLTGFKEGGGKRKIDYRFYQTTIADEVVEKIVETALRLKFNLIIPSSLIDITNPPEKRILDICARRGIFISQHHIEPLGLSHLAFENYQKEKGEQQVFSFIENREKVEEAWEHFAAKWAEYDNVVWQIGLRGRTDRPVWEENEPTDSELADYGKIISSALSTQKEIVKKVTNGKAKYFTSTLWMEGSCLAEKGYLDFGEDTIAVFSDNGPNQMFGADYYSVDRKSDRKYGIYYHLAYWGCGPHSAPQTGIDKIYHNLKLAEEKGDTDYVIFNVANVREFVFEMKACSEIVWDTDGFDKEEFLNGYCAQFGENANEMKTAICEYYNSLPEVDSSYLKYHLAKYFNYNYGEETPGVKNFIVKEGMILVNYGAFLVNEEFLSDKMSFMHDVLYKAIKAAIPSYRRCFDEFSEIAKRSDERLAKHITIKWTLAAENLLAIYEWYTLVYEGRIKYVEGDKSSAIDCVKEALSKLKGYSAFRKVAEYGWFKDWYKADEKLNLESRIGLTENLLQRLSE